MNKSFYGALCAGFFALGSVSTNAAFSYDEAVDGDIFLDTFSFDLGMNSIRGSTNISDNSSDPNRDNDGFCFSIADGMELVSATFEFSNILSANGTTRFGLGIGLSKFENGSFVDVSQIKFFDIFDASGQTALPSIINLFSGDLPLPNGFYSPIMGTSTVSGENGLSTYDYKFTFEVSNVATGTVPEPSILALLGLGLIGFMRHTPPHPFSVRSVKGESNV